MVDRSSGILLHPTSLPGGHGIGELGPDAHAFADTLERMRQSWWQMLPVGPTGYADSPYQSPSTFAGNPLLVSLDLLVEDGLVDASRLEGLPEAAGHEVDYGRVIPGRMELLDEVAAEFRLRAAAHLAGRFEAFCDEHGATWLDDFAVFTALKRSFHLRPWWEWDPALAARDDETIRAAREDLAGPIERVRVEQFLFDLHFRRLREACSARGIGLIGDIPIFVAHDSADVWANRELFWLDRRGQPTVVAGVPPDYFAATGQRWGNPLYHWARHREEGFAWWRERMRRQFSLFDLVRIDHFRGFSEFWAIPASEPTAVNGRWRRAPGRELFDTLAEEFPELPVIAEDLGIITPAVERLRDRYGFPGMKVLQFGFGIGTGHSPDEFGEHVVAYTGTHDNDTMVGWWNDPTREEEHEFARHMLGTDGSDIHWKAIEAVARSTASTVVFPLQDLLGLGSEARMNTPGTATGNWRWRFSWDQVTDEIVQRMRTLAVETGRG